MFLSAGFMIFRVWDMYQKNNLARLRRDEAQMELSKLEEQRDSLSASIASLRTRRGVEEEIRRNFLMVKEGEKVITIVDDPAIPQAKSETESNERSWWQRFIGLWSRN